MNSFLILNGLLVAALFASGCSGVPGAASPGPGGPDSDSARAALCDEGNDTSLANLADQLDTINEDTDVTLISTAIGTTMADLQSAQLDAGEMIVRDAAVTALGQLQTAISDPATRGQAAITAAAASRAAETEIC